MREKPGVCFIGHVRYAPPLNATEKKKLALLSGIADVWIIAFSKGIWPRILRDRATLILLPDLRLTTLKVFTQVTLGLVAVVLLAVTGRIEVIVAQSPLDGFTGALAKRASAILRRRVALVVENHGDYLESIYLQRKVSNEKLYRFSIRRMARLAIREADVVRAVSSETRNQLELEAPKKPAVQFIAWTDIDVFKNAYENLQGARRSQEVVCYVGVVIPGKGIHFLIDSFNDLQRDFPDAMLEIIGPRTNREYYEELRRQVSSLGLEGKVEFIDELSQEKLAEKLARARALALPSISEGLGRVILEAMACGVPAVSSDVGGIRDIVEDGKTGFLVPPEDIEALAEKLKLLLGNRELAVRMGEEARRRVDAVFSPRTYREGYEKLIATALEALHGVTA